ncbi:MAG: 50S ribosomal protein L21 [Planctomycetota bacterium]|jgi:large subunit ribosomal protein L21
MYAIVEDRGKQFKVTTGDEILVAQLASSAGTLVDFGQVRLLRSLEKGTLFGSPDVKGANVVARVMGEEKGPKVVSYKLRRRKNSRTKIGHRQKYTRLRIAKIVPPPEWSPKS